MNIKYLNESNFKDYDGVIFPVYEESLGVAHESLAIPFSQLKEKELFEGKKDQVHHVTIMGDKAFKDVVLVGLGKTKDVTGHVLRNAIADGFKVLKTKKVSSMGIFLDNVSEGLTCSYAIARNTVEAVVMANYTFDTYKSKEKKTFLEEVTLSFESIDDEFIEAFTEGKIIAEANLLTRELVNEPANKMYPEVLANRVIELGKAKGFEVEVFEQEAIEAMGMEAYMSVAMASDKAPKFIVMRYKGSDSEKTLGLVGKGLTYDSGGLSIKSTGGMVTMKSDMGGAAAVIGAMSAIAENKVKTNVVAVVAACENMIAGNSYKPGDIIGSMGGKNIFIGNTDAEGRLTLIDAMHYIVTKENVDAVVDIATLTGAAIHCLGTVATVAISNEDKFYGMVDHSFNKAGEKIWRMPIFDEYKEMIKHEDADLTNTAGSPGTITAGLFIGEFNGDLPWVHLDIAGSSWTSKAKHYTSKGGTGVGARSLYYLAKSYGKENA